MKCVFGVLLLAAAAYAGVVGNTMDLEGDLALTGDLRVHLTSDPSLQEEVDHLKERVADLTSRLDSAPTQEQVNALQSELDVVQTFATERWQNVVAQAACTAIGGTGWMFAVRRGCSTDHDTCAQVCAKTAGQDNQATIMTCVNSLHVYIGSSLTEKGKSETDIEVLGMKVHRYNSCGGGCGPNVCCCQGR